MAAVQGADLRAERQLEGDRGSLGRRKGAPRRRVSGTSNFLFPPDKSGQPVPWVVQWGTCSSIAGGGDEEADSRTLPEHGPQGDSALEDQVRILKEKKNSAHSLFFSYFIAKYTSYTTYARHNFSTKDFLVTVHPNSSIKVQKYKTMLSTSLSRSLFGFPRSVQSILLRV